MGGKVRQPGTLDGARLWRWFFIIGPLVGLGLVMLAVPSAASNAFFEMPTPPFEPEEAVLTDVAAALAWPFPRLEVDASGSGTIRYRMSQSVMAGADHYAEITCYPTAEGARTAFEASEGLLDGQFHGLPLLRGARSDFQSSHYQDARWMAWVHDRRVFRVMTSYNSTYRGEAADPTPLVEVLFERAVAYGLLPASQWSYVVSGLVIDAGGPVESAVVRVQATDHVTQTGTDGTFILELPGEGPFTVTAWAEGYFVGWVEEVRAGADDLAITLNPYYTTDNPDYDWFSMEGAEGSLSCSHCMPCYAEWQEDAHSQSAVNPRFLTMYNGTDVNGNRSPLTRYGYNRDYGAFPLPPDPSLPYYGPGYLLDFPDSAGNCATCHVPGAAARPGAAYAADVNAASGIELEGIFCEFCHKIGSVILDRETGFPYANMPGVLSMRLHRPEEDQQLFFGQFDDVTRRVSRLPLEEESAFCAPCHFGVFWDTVIYNSYGEWLESPYSDPETGQTCQDCHMPVAGYDYFVFPEQGGLHRDPSRILSHRMPGAADEAFLQNTAELHLSVEREGDLIHVVAEVTNAQAGHHIPTDSPLRQIFLVVTATDAAGQPLPLQAGPILPAWAGDLEGVPGVYFAMILQELWTEISPTGAYWMPTRVIEDTRLPALETATSIYAFTASDEGAITVQARLIFRRAFYELMQQKGWDVPDILMERAVVTVP